MSNASLSIHNVERIELDTEQLSDCAVLRVTITDARGDSFTIGAFIDENEAVIEKTAGALVKKRRAFAA